ncbi:MAG: hypothetical protein Q4D81_10740 [Eubacteriales bacterium]|nr:hypothetical protein [Eubacteriales bacterium]
MSTENTTIPAAEDAAEQAVEKTKGSSAKKSSSSLGKIFGSGKKSSKGKTDSGRNSEDDIKKLTRTELLELLIDETKEADRLRAENERLREELQRCRADLDRVASFEAVIARLEAIVARS